MEERTMDVIEKFGNRVSSQALKDPEKARRLLLAGYRLQEKKLQFLETYDLRQSSVNHVVIPGIIIIAVIDRIKLCKGEGIDSDLITPATKLGHNIAG